MPSLAFRKASICSRFSFSASCTLVVNPQHATRSRLILYWKRLLLAKNDLELYDLHEHPEEMNNLATDPIKHGELLVTLNKITSDLLAAEVTNPRREKVFSTSKQTLRAFDVGASRRRRRVRAIAAALLVVIPAPPMAAEMNCNTAGNGRSPTTNTVASD